MKRSASDGRHGLTALHAAMALLACALLPLLAYATAPDWWAQRGVLIANAQPDDYAPVNHGQLKNMAKAAAAEMDSRLPGGAGPALHDLVAGWAAPSAQVNDFAPANLGQVKAVAKLFYDRLIAVGRADGYPWVEGAATPDDFAVANIGQVKNLFTFELPSPDPLFDGNGNGLPDAWERQHFGNIGVDPNADPDFDGISNLQEYLGGNDPRDFYNGTLESIAITGGGDQRGDAGALSPEPVFVRVNPHGIPNAPIQVTVTQGGALLLPDNTGSAVPAASLALRTDDVYDLDGRLAARFYILLSPLVGDVSVIRVSTGGGGRTVAAWTTAVTIDPSLAPPSQLAVVPTSVSSAELTWAVANQNSSTMVQASRDGGRTWVTLGVVAPGVTRLTVTGLAPGQLTTFRVMSCGSAPATVGNVAALPPPGQPMPAPPPGGGGGGATNGVGVSTFFKPTVEIEQFDFHHRKIGFRGLFNQGLYREKTEVITSDYRNADGSLTEGNGSTIFRYHPRNGRTIEVIGDGGFLLYPLTTVVYTDTTLRQEGVAGQWGGGSSMSLSLTAPYTDAELYAEGKTYPTAFYDSFWEGSGSSQIASLRKQGGTEGFYSAELLRYRFVVNADPNARVKWDIQFTPEANNPDRITYHDVYEWISGGQSPSEIHLLDPRTLNGGVNAVYRLVLLGADLLVDGNRDGRMSFTDSVIRDEDRTSNAHPYRFWLNDDDDTALSYLEGGQPGEPMEVETVPAAQPDYSKRQIVSQRNLEDFSRLWIDLSSMHDALRSCDRLTDGRDAVAIGLKWKNAVGVPAINLYPSQDGAGSTDYLTNEGAAARQISSNTYDKAVTDKNNRKTVDTNAVFIFKEDYWDGVSAYEPNKRCFLFEGASEGKGELTVVFLDQDDNEIAEGGSVWLELKNIKKMYQRVDSAISNPWENIPFEPEAHESRDEAIVFVHGWRLSPAGAGNFAESMYKRLWHRGFTGRFAAFHWDTWWFNNWQWVNDLGGAPIEAALAHYNDSEHTAWQAAPALKAFVDGLPFTNINLTAHSMGNIVAGEALRLGMQVKNYALLQAAVPAACYDDSPSVEQTASYQNHGATMWDVDSPDDDPDAATRALSYRGRFLNVSGNLVSFFLPQDYATFLPWEWNNDQTKPPDGEFVTNFAYLRHAAAGRKLYKYRALAVDHYLTDPYEAMPYACRSWGKAAGAYGATGGAIDSVVDLSEPAFQLAGEQGQGFGDEHSGQFNANIQELKSFYDTFMDALEVRRNP